MLGGTSDYTTCPDCGTSLPLDDLDAARHRCDERQRNAHQQRLARAQAELLEAELAAFLETPQGRFATYYARRNRPPLAS